MCGATRLAIVLAGCAVVAATMPASCVVTNASDAFLHHAIAAFNRSNEGCLSDATACIEKNATSCDDFNCNADASSLSSACYTEAATLCRVGGGQALAAGGLPPFDVNTLACVPSACDLSAYQAYWRQQLCGVFVNETACDLVALSCDSSSPGSVWPTIMWTTIAGSLFFGACGLGYCWLQRKRMREEDEQEEGFYLEGELGDDVLVTAAPLQGSGAGAVPVEPEHDDPSATLIIEDDPAAAYTWAQRPHDPAPR